MHEEIAEGNRRNRQAIAGGSLLISGSLLGLAGAPLLAILSNTQLGLGVGGIGLLLMVSALVRR